MQWLSSHCYTADALIRSHHGERRFFAKFQIFGGLLYPLPWSIRVKFGTLGTPIIFQSTLFYLHRLILLPLIAKKNPTITQFSTFDLAGGAT